MATISAFRITQHSQIFSLSLEIEFNAMRFINYTIPSETEGPVNSEPLPIRSQNPSVHLTREHLPFPAKHI